MIEDSQVFCSFEETFPAECVQLQKMLQVKEKTMFTPRFPKINPLERRRNWPFQLFSEMKVILQTRPVDKCQCETFCSVTIHPALEVYDCFERSISEWDKSSSAAVVHLAVPSSISLGVSLCFNYVFMSAIFSLWLLLFSVVKLLLLKLYV